MIARPEGIILVTGPTGSGKTTTLYSMLNHINSEGLNIMTLEDPVEYPMTLIRQTSVAEAAKLDFANGIRSMMRQDPDVILVGEIRDADTAEMALPRRDDRPPGVFDAAHQLGDRRHSAPARHRHPARHHGRQHHRHHRAAPGAPACACTARRPTRPRRTKRACSACAAGRAPRPVIYRPCGCERCDFQGYRGRLAIMELLRIDGDMDELIARRGTAREIRQLAERQGLSLAGRRRRAARARRLDLARGTRRASST